MTLVDTEMIAERALMVPLGVTTEIPLRVSIDVAGVETCTVSPWASDASSMPRPCLAKAAVLRSAALAKSNADTDVKSFAQLYGPSTNSTVGFQSPRSAGMACSQGASVLRAMSSMARVARTCAL